MREFFRVLLLILLVIASAFAQGVGLSVFGIRLNLVLVVIIFIALKEDVLISILAAACAVFVLKPGPAIDLPITLLGISGPFTSITRRFLPWQEPVVYLALIVFMTFVLYFASSIDLLLSMVFLREVLANIVTGVVFFAIFSGAWHNA